MAATTPSTTLPPGSVVLSLSGYIVDLVDVKPGNAEPLFTWLKHDMHRSLDWGSSAFRRLQYQGFWATEVAIYQDGHYQHLFPGAYITVYGDSPSIRSIQHAWEAFHDEFTFRDEDIVTSQYELRLLLEKACAAPHTVLYHKGSNIDKALATLLSVTAVNVYRRGLKRLASTRAKENDFCKVHTHSLRYCPKAHVQYFLRQVHQWYHPPAPATNDWTIDIHDNDDDSAWMES